MRVLKPFFIGFFAFPILWGMVSTFNNFLWHSGGGGLKFHDVCSSYDDDCVTLIKVRNPGIDSTTKKIVVFGDNLLSRLFFPEYKISFLEDSLVVVSWEKGVILITYADGTPEIHGNAPDGIAVRLLRNP